MSLTIDSFAWIELIRGTSRGTRAKTLIEAADNTYTPAIVLAEVAHRCLRDGMELRVVEQELLSMAESSTVVAIDVALATEASSATTELLEHARTRRIQKPGLGDGLVLATARMFGTKLLTGDPHFQGLEETLWLE